MELMSENRNQKKSTDKKKTIEKTAKQAHSNSKLNKLSSKTKNRNPSSFIKPLPIKNLLSNQFRTTPRYAIKVKLSSSGDILSLADPKATRALIALMDMQATLGGAASHFGGPSAFAELMSSVFGLAFLMSSKAHVPWFEMFHIVNDAGHCENGIYALKANYEMAHLSIEKLKSFRSLGSPLTGHGESHLFPEGVYLSNGPLGSALPQAQGLAFGDALSGTFSRLTLTTISDGACMEGEAKESLAAIPGFAKKGKMAPFLLILSDNNTKLSGRIDEESFSMKPSFLSLENLGWNVLHLENTHDLETTLNKVSEAIQKAKANPKHPVLLHAKTVKGYGTKKTETSLSGGHGFPLKDPKDLKDFLKEIYKEDSIPKEFLAWCDDMVKSKTLSNHPSHSSPALSSSSLFSSSISSSPQKEEIQKEKIQVGISKALKKKKLEGLPIISISSDLSGSTGTKSFQSLFPESSTDVGVAEANMISMGGGLSKQGFIPIVDTFAQFGVTKGALPLTMAILSEAPVIAIFSHAGFQDAADGASHQALSYYGMTSSIPQTYVHHLSCSEEAEALLLQAIDYFHKKRNNSEVPYNQIFFLGRENFPKNYSFDDSLDKTTYKLKQAQVLFNNLKLGHSKSILIATAGSLIQEALFASRILEGEGINSVVINVSCINHPDVQTFKTYLPLCGNHLLTVEEHQLKGGMGSQLVHALTLNLKSPSLKVLSLGVKNQFGQSAYKAIDLYKKHGLDGKSIALKAKEFLKTKEFLKS